MHRRNKENYLCNFAPNLKQMNASTRQLESTMHSKLNLNEYSTFSYTNSINVLNSTTRSRYQHSNTSQLSSSSFNRSGPIKTRFSIVSVEQQAEFPMAPTQAIRQYGYKMTQKEKAEILSCTQVYFLSELCNKTSDSYDEPTGDYKITLHDHIAYQYEIISILGKGSFGRVVKAYDHKHQRNVALKIIKNRPNFQKQATTEIKVLKRLLEHDLTDHYHTIRMHHYFTFREHICISFELMSINLYEFMKSNKFKPASISLLKRFAFQILQSMRLMRKTGIIHCDLKPENILLKERNRSRLKVIDFGSAWYDQQKVFTYIQSRYYRAPEIILGIPYSSAIDMWSFGWILVELLTGRPLFPGENEKEQIQCIMEVLGPPPSSVLRFSTRKHLYFHGNGEPRSEPSSKGVYHSPGRRPLSSILGRLLDEEGQQFILKWLSWNADDRPCPDKAIRDAWIQE